MSETATATRPAARNWAASNQAYLAGELRALRLRLQRRVLWLRHRWRPDPLRGYQGVVSDQQADWLLAGDDPEAEQQFYGQDQEAAAITRALQTAKAELTKLVERMEGAGNPPPLSALARLLDLTVFEQRVLLLCLAPHLDPAFAQLYAYTQDQANLTYATPHLALALYARDAESRAQARNSFLPAAPLRRIALVEMAAGSADARLQIDRRVADYLQGINRLDSQIVELLEPAAAGPLAPAHQAAVEKLHQWCGSQPAGPLVLNLMGRRDSGRQAVGVALCGRLGLRLLRLDLARTQNANLPTSRLLPLLAREAALSGLGYYLDLTDPDPAFQPAAQLLVERLEAVLVIGSEKAWPAERQLLALAVPKPSPTEQQQLWQQALAGTPHRVGDQLDKVVQQFDFGPQAVVRAVAAARDLALLRSAENGASVSPADLWQACRQQSGPQLDQLARRIEPAFRWDDIVLPADLLLQLRELAAQVAHRQQVYESWGFGVYLSRGRGISALFAGPSGTGKTMAAEILANGLQLDLYRIDLAGVVSKYIGETEKNLKQVFDAAEQSGAILFFDEADALFGKRTEVKDSHDRYANIEVNYLLQRMEDYRGLAILATNRKSALDRAFLRRLRFLLDFPFPDADGRRAIWHKVFPAGAPLDDLDFTVLARLEIPGGNIRNIALNAAFLAAAEKGTIGMAQVMHAARREYGKMDKMMTPAEFGDYYRMVQP